MKYSERLGEITLKQLQQACDKHSLGKIIATEQIKEGMFGQNLFLTTEAGKFVLRGKPHFDWQFPTEQFFAEKLHHADIPTPFPYIVDADTSIFGWSYVIMPRLEGISISSKLNEPYLSGEDRVGIAKAQGAFLAKIQTLKLPHCGHYDIQAKAITPVTRKYSSWVSDAIINRLQAGYDLKPWPTFLQDMEWVKAIVSQAEEANVNDFTPTIVLQDYKFENTLARKVNEKWELCALFDLMECYAGNGEVDLVRTYCKYINAKRNDLAEIFLGEWEKHAKPVARYRERFPFFVLLDRSIIWEWNRRDPHAKQPELREYVEGYLKHQVEYSAS